MIARFAGPYANCGATILKGDDCEYDSKEKRVRHWNCPSEGAGSEDAERIADRLAYCRFRPEDNAEGLLRRMLPRD